MADMLATAADLRLRLQIPEEEWDADAATVLLEAATGLVQAEVRQRLVEVEDDEIVLLGTTERWLDLPQRPVTSVSSAAIDGGDELTDYKRFGARLWRRCGWASCPTEPATVEITYTHGYAADAQELQPARAIVLAAAGQAYSNPSGVTSERIDDYGVSWGTVAAAMTLSEHACKALHRAYGRRGGLVRIG